MAAGDEDRMALAREVYEAMLVQEIEGSAFNAFRSQLKDKGLTLSSAEASNLYKAVKAEWAGAEEEEQNGGPSGDNEHQGPELEPAVEDAQQEKGMSWGEIRDNYFTPILDEEALKDYEERLGQGLVLVKDDEYDSAELAMLYVLQQAHIYLEALKKGLVGSQVRVILKGMSRRIKETPELYARRYTATLEVYVRMVGPQGLEASLCTKARSLLEAAGLPVLQKYQSADEALSSSGSGGARSERFVSPSTPTREGVKAEFDLSSPVPRMPGTTQWAPGPVQGASPPPAKQEVPPFRSFGNRRVAEEEEWEHQSLSPSQSNTEVAALLQEMKEARIQDVALRKKS